MRLRFVDQYYFVFIQHNARRGTTAPLDHHSLNPVTQESIAQVPSLINPSMTVQMAFSVLERLGNQIPQTTSLEMCVQRALSVHEEVQFLRNAP